MSILIPPYQQFYNTVQKQPDSVFLRQPFHRKWNEYTWREVDEQVRKMAAYLQGLGLEPGSKVAIISKNCAHWVMSDLAIMMAGYISVPLYPTISADTIEYVMKHSDTKVAFIGKLDDWQKQKRGLPTGVHTISYPFWTEQCDSHWDDIIKNTAPLNKIHESELDDLMTIIYTSGTTGLPKGVMHTYRSFPYAITHALKELEKISGGEKFFSYLPLSHIAERMLVEMGGLYSGGTIAFAESLESFPEDLQTVQPTVFLAVPRIWTKFQMGILSKLPAARLQIMLSIPFVNTLIKKKIKHGLGLSEAKYILAGAAPLPVSTMKWFDKLDIKICEAYAMTENSAYSHITRPEKRKPGSVGQPFPNVEVRISEEGEIQTRSQANMIGYFKDEEKTKETILEDGFLCTGDQGEVDKDGFLKITGRIKDIFKTDKGKYVAPAPIEMVLSKNTLIEQVCVVGSNLPQTMAMVVLSLDAKHLSQEEIAKSLSDTMQEVNAHLDKHEKLKKIIVMKDEWSIENQLMTPTLKVKRNVLENKYQSVYQNWYQKNGDVIWE